MKKSTEGLASCCICEQIFDEKVMIYVTNIKKNSKKKSRENANSKSVPIMVEDKYNENRDEKHNLNKLENDRSQLMICEGEDLPILTFPFISGVI